MKNLYNKYAIATSDYYATKIGKEILDSGGNIFDAAVSIGFCLGLTEPYASGLGGGGLCIIRTQDNKEIFLDFREFSYNKNIDSLEKNKVFCIPTEVYGLFYILNNYGMLNIKEILKPILKLCKQGFKADKLLSITLEKYKKNIKLDKELSKIYINNTDVYKEGEIILNNNLYNTLLSIYENNLDGFYDGFVCDSILKTFNEKENLINKFDLKNIKVYEKKPLIFDYKEYKFILPSLPSCGGILLIQMLKLFDYFKFKKADHNFYHILIEIFKCSYIDRFKYLRDINYSDENINYLISDRRIKKFYELIDINKAFDFNIKTYLDNPHTTHYSLADINGNMISLTKTINGYFGSFKGVEGCGFVLNDSMLDFDFYIDSKNKQGPFKRPISFMTPTIVLKNNKPFLVLGSPGGNKIVSTVFQTLIKIINFDYNINDAVNDKRIWYDINSKKVIVEKNFNKDIVNHLQKKGHMIEYKKDDFSSGSVQTIIYNDSEMIAKSDDRKFGYSIVF